ncbi:PspC domain-containing protein [Anaerotalea alkaliphila]|uniref:PspC domain-containing protein n=1 Tax=Anaerotalea alkaliphila TaxID=2662126 RepID=A0A7X5HV34_9FIRM|nr:PspC domain-containing protein [Anaerotalea alkaliphila]
MDKKLYRSRSDRMLAGVCGGLGKYLGIDPTLIRLVFIIMVFAGFSGILTYIIAMIVIPEQPLDIPEDDVEVYDKDGKRVHVDTDTQKKTKQLLGGLLIIMGAALLFEKFFNFAAKELFLGVAIVLVGLYLLLGPAGGSKE